MNKHWHLFAHGASGEDYINTVYNNEIDAATDFMAISGKLMQQTPSSKYLVVEAVVNDIREDDQAVIIFTDAIWLVVSGCTGDCFSPTWN